MSTKSNVSGNRLDDDSSRKLTDLVIAVATSSRGDVPGRPELIDKIRAIVHGEGTRE